MSHKKMKKLFALIIFGCLNIQAMDAPMPTADDPRLTTRKFISLNEALRLGTLVAKDEILEFPDFESALKPNLPLYSMPLKNINPYIYEMLADTSETVDVTNLVKENIKKNMQLTNQEILNYQIPLVQQFLTDLDLTVLARNIRNMIKSNLNACDENKKKACDRLKFDKYIFTFNRSSYKAALAALNLDAINTSKKRQMYFEEPLTIIQEIVRLRDQAQKDIKP
jgi:hypothetical protein